MNEEQTFSSDQRPATNDSIVIFTDGGSRGNPGPAAYGFVVKRGEDIVYGQGGPIGIETNNVAEYTAVREAFSWVASNRDKIGEYSGIQLFLDSLLVCQQLAGKYKITKPHLQEFYNQIQQIIAELHVPVTYTHVLREKNTIADSLVNRALDSNQTVSLE